MLVDIQKAIDWIEGNLEDDISLDDISDYIMYSKYHTTRQFKRYTGSTLKKYIQLRRLTKAAIKLRDHHVRIIDVAVMYGYSSQEAFTRAFKDVFGLTPYAYQKNKKMVPYILKQDVLFPDNLPNEGEIIMVKDSEIKMSLEEMPAHQFIYLEKDGVDNYIDFWEEMEQEGHDCDKLHGVLASIPGHFNEGYGGFRDDGYLFGTDAPLDYEVDPSYGFKVKQVETKKYLRFEHPGFKEVEFEEALRQVRRIALKEFDFDMKDYERDTSFVNAYEHSGMEICYYFIRIPLTKS